jgi:CelD/BcsL family acetyltransferase involved in cellulose biosynthesis
VSQLTVHDEPFDRVRAEWEGLLAQTPSPMPFVTPAWQQVWLEHFGGGRTLRVFTARDGERLVGVAPLLVDEGRAEFVGHYSICDYMDVVVTPGFEAPFFPSLISRLADEGVREMDFRGVLETSCTKAGVSDAAAAAGYTVTCEDEAVSPGICLPATWDEYLGSLSKKDRHELRRKLRRLEMAGGDLDLRVITVAAEAQAELDEFFRLMRLSSHHKEEFLERPGMETFFRTMTGVMAGEGMLRMYMLTLDGQAVAAVLNFDVGGQLYMYNSGYDPAYAHYAVGLMSKALLVKDAIENGRSCVDFLRGHESYKYDLGGKDRQVYRLVATR